MLTAINTHTELIGKICKITRFGVELQKEYKRLFGIGSHYVAKTLFDYCYSGNEYELSLVFTQDAPIRRNGVVFYCLKEVGEHSSGEYHWLSLNQIIICI